jgi:hypothetical protein
MNKMEALQNIGLLALALTLATLYQTRQAIALRVEPTLQEAVNNTLPPAGPQGP